MKKIIIDKRMRELEKDFLKSLGYGLVEIQKSDVVYPEISSHVDIFVFQIDDTLIVEKSQYRTIKNQLEGSDIKVVERRRLDWKILSRRCKIQCLSNWQTCVA